LDGCGADTIVMQPATTCDKSVDIATEFLAELRALRGQSVDFTQ
jgi:hypothetical protein